MSASVRLLPKNMDVTLFASASRTTLQTGTTQYNHDALGALITLAVASITATPGLTLSIQHSYDNGTTWVTYFTAAAAVVTAVTFTYLLYPGILASADGAVGESVNLPLPRCWRCNIAVADADEATYQVRAQLL